MADQQSTYYYRDTSRRCSFRPVLQTERLNLTIWDLESQSDNEAGLAFFKDAGIVGALGKPLFETVEQVKACRISTQLMPEHIPLKEQVSGPSVWFIRLRSQGDNASPIGMINISGRDPDVPTDIGWCVIQAFQGRGYATEAAMRVAEYMLDEFQGGFRNATPPCGLVATLNEKNAKSAVIARKVGLVPMGNIRYVGSKENVVVYGVPGLNINRGKPFTPDLRVNVFGWGEPLKRTLRLLYGQEEVPEGALDG